MSKLKRMWRSFHKNIIIKRKFKSYWTSLVDSEYRNQIKNIFELTKNTTGSRIETVPTHLLVHGHKVIYHEYALSLMMDDSAELQPIKVFKHNEFYVVIDGNHRLPAIISRDRKFNTGLVMAEVIF